MMNQPQQALNTYLMLRVTDTIRIRLRRKLLPLACACPVPRCFQFTGGQLSALPSLEDIRLAPTRGACCLDAVLRLPLSLSLMCECEHCTVCGTLSVPVQAMLRACCPAPMQFVPQAEVCICDVQLSDGCLCVLFDLMLTLYAACLEPVQLPVLCAPACSADCSHLFNLPLYPQLPRPK